MLLFGATLCFVLPLFNLLGRTEQSSYNSNGPVPPCRKISPIPPILSIRATTFRCPPLTELTPHSTTSSCDPSPSNTNVVCSAHCPYVVLPSCAGRSRLVRHRYTLLTRCHHHQQHHQHHRTSRPSNLTVLGLDTRSNIDRLAFCRTT